MEDSSTNKSYDEEEHLRMSDVFIEIVSRTSLKTFDILRCTSKSIEKLTYNSHVHDLYKRRNNVYFGVIIQQKKPWGTIEHHFVPSCGAKNFDIGCVPNMCTILASSLHGLILGECDNRDEYPEKFLFVCKPTTFDAKSIPHPIAKYIPIKFAMVVMLSKSLHFKIIPLSYEVLSELIKDQVDYDNFQLELLDSTTWKWRELRNIRLPSSVYPLLDEAIISGGVVYILLSNYDILQFDVYSEEYVVMFPPSIIIDINSYASRLIKFDGKLGYFSLSGDRLWAIWVLIQNRWVKVDVSNDNVDANEWWDYRKSALSFFKGNTIEYVVPTHCSHEVFSFRSDFEIVTMPSRNVGL